MKSKVVDFNTFINNRDSQLEDMAFEKQKEFFRHLQNHGIKVKEILETISFIREEIPLWADLIYWEVSHPKDGTTRVILSHNNHVLRLLGLEEGLSKPAPYPTIADTTPLVDITFTPPKGVSVLRTLSDHVSILKSLADSVFDTEEQDFIAPVAYIPLYYLRCVVEQAVQMTITEDADCFQAEGHLYDGTGYSLTFYRKECLAWTNWHGSLYAQLQHLSP